MCGFYIVYKYHKIIVPVKLNFHRLKFSTTINSINKVNIYLKLV